jgi:short-subunit dehydrogenase
MRSLTDMVVVITGASRGIGAGMAKAFAAEECRLVLAARKKTSLEKMARTLKLPADRILSVAANVSTSAGMKKIVESAYKKFGRIDVFINNAGIGLSGPVTKVSEREFDDLIATNLKSVFLSFKFLLPRMQKQGGGQIINVSSMAGRQAVPGMAVYAAGKAALNILSESVGGEVRSDNIKVCTLAPASTDTHFGGQARSIRDQSASGKRKLSVEEVAEAAVFLARQNENAWLSSADLRPLRLKK